MNIKKLLKIFLIFFALGLPTNSFAQLTLKDCNEKYNKFYNSNAEIPDSLKADLEVCRVYCEKMPNLKDVYKFCGVDQCLNQYIKKGKVTDWCCQLKNNYEGKKGSIKNPLQGLGKACEKNDLITDNTDVMGCIELFNVNKTVSEACCRRTDDVSKFSDTIGKRFSEICSTKRAAAVCGAQFAAIRRFDGVCCGYYNANAKKFKGTSEFLDNEEYAIFLESRAKNCISNEEIRKDNLELFLCTEQFKYQKNIRVEDCCISFYNGYLIPSEYGMSYNEVNKACFPEEYSN